MMFTARFATRSYRGSTKLFCHAREIDGPRSLVDSVDFTSETDLSTALRKAGVPPENVEADYSGAPYEIAIGDLQALGFKIA